MLAVNILYVAYGVTLAAWAIYGMLVVPDRFFRTHWFDACLIGYGIFAAVLIAVEAF